MKQVKLPYQINDYITDHFKEDFLFAVKDVRKVRNHWIYTVEVSKDNEIRTLKFNGDGKLLDADTQTAYMPDIHEEPTYGDIPE